VREVAHNPSGYRCWNRQSESKVSPVEVRLKATLCEWQAVVGRRNCESGTDQPYLTAGGSRHSSGAHGAPQLREMSICLVVRLELRKIALGACETHWAAGLCGRSHVDVG
jgi:hypothetical protein